jgi:hypothetical protein
MRAAAGFHHDAAGRVPGEEVDEGVAPKLALEQYMPVGVVADKVKAVLANVDADQGNGSYDDLLYRKRNSPASLRLQGCGRADHHIKVGRKHLAANLFTIKTSGRHPPHRRNHLIEAL